MRTRLVFSRPLADSNGPNDAVPLAPLASVLTDGILTALIATKVVDDASTPEGHVRLSIQLSPLLRENREQLIEVVLGSRADLLWSNRDSLSSETDPLFAVLNPPPPPQVPLAVRSFRLARPDEAARLVVVRFLETLGRLPDRPTVITLAERLQSGALTPAVLTRQLIRSDEAQSALAQSAFLPDAPSASTLLAEIADRWLVGKNVGGTHPAAVSIVRDRPPPGAHFSDLAAGVHLRADNGATYEGGWFGPAVSFIAEFDRGHGILAFDVWRPDIVRGDVTVRGGGEGFDIFQRWADDRLSVAIVSRDVNLAGFEIVTRTPFVPDNDDERVLGFLIDAPRAIMTALPALTNQGSHGQ